MNDKECRMALKNRIILIAGDILAALLALPASLAVKLRALPGPEDIRALGWGMVAGFVAVVVFLSFLAEFYGSHRDLFSRQAAMKTGLSLGLSSIILSLAPLPAMPVHQGSGMLLTAVMIFGLLQFLYHLAYRMCIRFRGFASRVVILGVGPIARHVGKLLPLSDKNYVLSGFVNCSEERTQVPEEALLETRGGLYETIKREKADKIVVSLSERRGIFPYQDVMACKLEGVEVIDAPSFYEQITGKLLLESINPSWIIFSDGFRVSAWRRALKRALDLVCAVIGILLTLPLAPLIALAIRLDSPGPIFYGQERVGEKESRFRVWKFRTMRSDAESGTGAVWAQQNDSRITRVGGFLRKSRIDELPQFFNVLRGDMSMVGPRPERPEFVEKLKEIIPYYSERHFVKPGVTGWAQIRYPYGASVEDALEKLRYDLYYIKHLSLVFDLLIILETVQVVLFRRGAR